MRFGVEPAHSFGGPQRPLMKSLFRQTVADW